MYVTPHTQTICKISSLLSYSNSTVFFGAPLVISVIIKLSSKPGK